ncbi:conserved protein of unknown function [Tenacibaculum sp. 190130A14a]|uniref:Uncharacterized protein n=1 Tax=Tenacibaculum polynesiense TaxID=3137857 RepID=A0ABM9PE43_9FLAO
MKEQNSSKHREVEKLKQHFELYHIVISAHKEFVRNDLFFVEVVINSHTFKILVEDEYRDFSTDSPLMNWYLVLISLELFNETEDILEWSNELNIPPTMFLEYYKSLATIYQKIEKLIGKVDPCISSFDYFNKTSTVRALLK